MSFIRHAGSLVGLMAGICWSRRTVLMPLLALCLQLGRVRRHTGTDGSFSRPRVMAQTAWFSRVIAEQKLESQMSLGKRRDANEAADQCPVEVIVNVSKGTVYEGPLTAWTNEEEVLWETLGRPYGAMSLCVQHSIILQRPCVMQRPSQVKIPIFSPAVPASGVRLKGFDTAARHELLDEAGLLRALQVSADELRAFFNQPVCFVVHPVILELIRRSAWVNADAVCEVAGATCGATFCPVGAMPCELQTL